MDTSVIAPATCHRRVEDWPRWMDDGSAANCAMTGAAGGRGGGAGAWATGGGGGGGAAAFFLQPTANAIKIMMAHKT
jgi:hypothetical protein